MMKFVKTLDLTEEEKEKLFHLNAEKYILNLS
jgi:predicted TIM-barrel fold metal-dependent hydrolase